MEETPSPEVLKAQAKIMFSKSIKFGKHKRRPTKSRNRKEDVELANAFNQLGLLPEFLKSRENAFNLVPKVFHGRRSDSIPIGGLNFILENFDAQSVMVDGRPILQFSKPEKETQMSLYTQLVERSGQPKKVVKAVYEALIREIHVGLRKDRRIRLPELAVVKVSYRPAKEKRKGRSPFDGKPMIFKAKPASNKLKFSPVKDFKDWCAEKVEVVAPEKKKKKNKD